MEIIRYILLLAIIAGSTSVGFLASKGYSSRVNELNLFVKLLNILQNKIKFTQKPLAEIFEEISYIKENPNISKIFLTTSNNLKNKTIEESWNEAIDAQKLNLNLKKEDISIIKTLGNVLGKSDISGQMSEINQYINLINGQIIHAEEEKNKNAKMCRSLGSIVGLAIVIILY